MSVSQEDLDVVATQLGRAPRGVLDISYRTPDGVPAVVKTAPRLDDGTPFPTLYYLTEPRLAAEASRLEVAHIMKWMTQRLAEDAELRADYEHARDLRGTVIPADWPTTAELGIRLEDFDFSRAGGL